MDRFNGNKTKTWKTVSISTKNKVELTQMPNIYKLQWEVSDVCAFNRVKTHEFQVLSSESMALKPYPSKTSYNLWKLKG